MDKNISDFKIKYEFIDDTHETELSIYIDDVNILAFKRNEALLTTRWNLDSIANWLRNFIDAVDEDPFPFDVDGEFSAIKDIAAREFDSEDIDEIEAHYNSLYDWNLRHRWHTESSGAILADVYYLVIGDKVEISWNNTDSEEDVEFILDVGGTHVLRTQFYQEVDSFLKDYADHWYNV